MAQLPAMTVGMAKLTFISNCMADLCQLIPKDRLMKPWPLEALQFGTGVRIIGAEESMSICHQPVQQLQAKQIAGNSQLHVECNQEDGCVN